jgi:polar amino acid transport system permease protein
MFDFEFIRNNWLFIAAGTGATLGITISSLLLAIPIAVLVANARRSPFRPFRALATFFIWLVDGIPLLIQIPFYFLALPQLGILLPGLWAAIVVLVVYYSPRLSALFSARPVSLETIREGGWRTFLPGVGREFVSMIKDSTLLSMTGFLHDIYWRSRRVGRAEFHNLEALVVAAVLYLILNTVISLTLGVHKARLPVADPGVASSS